MSKSIFSSTAVPLFEIRPDRDVLVLRGSEEEAAGVVLKGVVALCVRDTISVKAINLKIVGSSCVGWNEGGARQKVHKHAGEFLYKSWILHTNLKSDYLSPGNYEFPFEMTIPGDSPESVEGLQYSWIVYRMKASIDRGLLASKISAQRHLRIVRTLSENALELSHAMSVENIWPHKIEYLLSTASKAVVFGTQVPIKMHLTPLLKGLEIGRIQARVTESIEIDLPDRELYKYHRDISHIEFTAPREATFNEQGQEGYSISESIPLPKRLGVCIQDVHARRLKVRHKVRFVIQLLNPDGHTSELRASLPVNIFLSPALSLSESGDVTIDHAALASNSTEIPPQYGDHTADTLWSDVDLSGYQTPQVLSRSSSSENLAPLTPMHDMDLHSRLRLLRSVPQSPIAPESAPALASYDRRASLTQDYFSSRLSRQPSSSSSSSENNEPHTPTSVEALSRVPSYSTATKDTRNRTSQWDTTLPQYEDLLAQAVSIDRSLILSRRRTYSSAAASTSSR